MVILLRLLMLCYYRNISVFKISLKNNDSILEMNVSIMNNIANITNSILVLILEEPQRWLS
jgi:hypothetical protein